MSDKKREKLTAGEYDVLIKTIRIINSIHLNFSIEYIYSFLLKEVRQNKTVILSIDDFKKYFYKLVVKGYITQIYNTYQLNVLEYN